MRWIERTAPFTAWTAAAISIAIAAAGALLAASGQLAEVPFKQLFIAAIWAVPGALIAAGRPRIAVGWLLLGVALFFAGTGLADQWVRHASNAGTEAGVDWAIWFIDRFSAYLVVLTFLALMLLPDGRLPSPRWRKLVWAVVGMQLIGLSIWVTVQGPAAAPDSDFPATFAQNPNPVGVLPPFWGEVVNNLEALLLEIPLLLCPVAFAVRLRRAKGEDRSRVASFLLAAGVFVLLVVLGHAFWPSASDVLGIVGGLVLAASLTTAVLKGRMTGVQVVIHHAVVYLLATLMIAGLYVLIVTLAAQAGQELPAFGAGVIVAVVVLGALPARDRFQRLAGRMVYGDRGRPDEGLRRLADNTQEAPTLDAALNELSATVAWSLRVPWVEVRTETHTGIYGAEPLNAPTISSPLMSRDLQLGTISVAAGPGRTLNNDDVRLLSDLARYGGVVVHSILLAGAVLVSRQRLVMSREEERQRLRRDLHDELGPTMASIAMQLGALRGLVHSDPDTAAERISNLQDASSQALQDIRRVASALRPPVLDQLGLLSALRQLADSLGLSLEMAEIELCRLPAAVEVAAYRIGAEALTNVARHADTGQAVLSVSVSGETLVIEVSDNGRGINSNNSAGVGIQAMRERAEELGGSLAIDSTPGQGTKVTTSLPLILRETGIST